MVDFSDKEIIELLKKRQSNVIRYLVDRYLPMINLLVSQTDGTRDDAYEIFTEALEKIMEKIDSNDFVLTCKFKTFLYAVSENIWKDRIEERKNKSKRLKPDSINDEEIQKDLDILLKNQLKDFEPDLQSALLLHSLGVGIYSIAEILHWKDDDIVKKKIKRAQRQLAATIKENAQLKNQHLL